VCIAITHLIIHLNYSYNELFVILISQRRNCLLVEVIYCCKPIRILLYSAEGFQIYIYISRTIFNHAWDLRVFA